jgi:hypothetical protein
VNLSKLNEDSFFIKQFAKDFPVPPFHQGSIYLTAPPPTPGIQPIDQDQMPIRAQPLIPEHSGLVGTAFHYLLDIYVRQLNPTAITSEWAAERFLQSLQNYLQRNAKPRFQKSLEGSKKLIRIARLRLKKAEQLMSKARDAYEHFLSQGVIDNQLLRSVIFLAQMDPKQALFQGYNEYELGKTCRRDVKDLDTLINLVNPNLFKANETCVINPKFQSGPRRYGGAQADLVIDDTLIEVKTKYKLQVYLPEWYQILAYFALTTCKDVDGMNRSHTIKKLGIYFARFGELFIVETKDIVKRKSFRSLVRWADQCCE